MRLRFRCFGYTLASLTLDTGPALKILEQEEEAPPGITGGSGDNFERDQYPPDPMREEPWPEERRRFGFR